MKDKQFLVIGLSIICEVKYNFYYKIYYFLLKKIPALALSYLVVEKKMFGRRNTMIISYAFASVSCFAAYFSYRTTFVVFTTFSRFFLNININMLYPYTSELYPTYLRATGFGIASGSFYFILYYLKNVLRCGKDRRYFNAFHYYFSYLYWPNFAIFNL